MTDSEARGRLAELMEERRLELHLTWREVAEAAGVSYEAIRDVRVSRTRPIRPLTRRGIDRGLRWAEGSGVDNILAGRDPLPAGTVPAPASDPARAQAEEFAREYGIDPDSDADPFRAAVRREVSAAVAAHGENPPGALVFHGHPHSGSEAMVWDTAAGDRDSRELLIAGMRAERARYEASRDGTRHGTAGLALRSISGGP